MKWRSRTAMKLSRRYELSVAADARQLIVTTEVTGGEDRRPGQATAASRRCTTRRSRSSEGCRRWSGSVGQRNPVSRQRPSRGALKQGHGLIQFGPRADFLSLCRHESRLALQQPDDAAQRPPELNFRLHWRSVPAGPPPRAAAPPGGALLVPRRPPARFGLRALLLRFDSPFAGTSGRPGLAPRLRPVGGPLHSPPVARAHLPDSAPGSDAHGCRSPAHRRQSPVFRRACSSRAFTSIGQATTRARRSAAGRRWTPC